MKSEWRVSSILLRVLPSLLLTTGYAGVAQAQEDAPIIELGSPCPAPPANRTYRIYPGTAPSSNESPYIAANYAATWSAIGIGASPCSGSGTTFTCAGLTVTLPSNEVPQTPEFTGVAVEEFGVSQMLRVTATNQHGHVCSADFTFVTSNPVPGYGWGTAKSCSTADECGTGYCVDGVCCDTGCDEQCEACGEDGLEGTCVAVVGEPRGTRTACAGDHEACGGSCDGEERDACTYPDQGTLCEAAGCSGKGVLTPARTCDGMGSCALEEKQMCHPYACDAEAEACGQSCWNDNDCAAGFECLADECVEEETDPGDGASSGGGSGTSSGDGNGGDGACETGNEGCECFGNDTCNGDLSCLSGLCVDAGGEGEGDSDGNSNKDESEAAGCGCSTVGRDQFPRGSSLWFALALGGLLLWWRRGRLRRVVGAGSP